MIISIIIVLCVAAAVAAYGLINGNDATFSNLAGVDSGGDSGSGTGHGNNTTNLKRLKSNNFNNLFFIKFPISNPL